jgi:hypothetical protein
MPSKYAGTPLEGTACTATYCQDRITDADPATDVPRDLVRRADFLYRVWQEQEGYTTHHERVRDEINECEARKAAGKKLARLRLHKRHFPEGSFVRALKAEVLKDNTVLPFDVREFKKHEKARKRDSEKRSRDEVEESVTPLPQEDIRHTRRKKRKIQSANPEELMTDVASATKELDFVRSELNRLRGELERVRSEKAALESQSEAREASLKGEKADLEAKLKHLAESDTVEKVTWDTVCTVVRLSPPPPPAGPPLSLPVFCSAISAAVLCSARTYVAHHIVCQPIHPQVLNSDESVNDLTPLPTARSLELLLSFCEEFKLHWWYEGRDTEGKRIGNLPKVAFKEALLQTLIVCALYTCARAQELSCVFVCVRVCVCAHM